MSPTYLKITVEPEGERIHPTRFFVTPKSDDMTEEEHAELRDAEMKAQLALVCAYEREDGRTPLGWAAKTSSNETVRLLLECGTDVNAVTSNSSNQTSFNLVSVRETRETMRECVSE